MAEEGIQSVVRTFQILEELAARQDMGVRELHSVTGLSVATVHRILTTLVSLGYVRQSKETGRYEMTYKMSVLGYSVTRHNEVVQLVHPLLKKLSDEVGETIHFAERAGANIRYIDKVMPTSGVVVMTSYVGMELPMYSTAVGKAMMAEMSQGEVERIWAQSEIVAYTKRTIHTLEELQRQLVETKKVGLAYDWEEREYGISCVAAGILDVTGEPAYAISISGPHARMEENQERYARLLEQTRKEISNLIGYPVR
ncbi:MAG: IclR family transcriptional regulator [Lawsonibacter sp.]|jgi:IclR family KDG regulon transcriptional repressor